MPFGDGPCAHIRPPRPHACQLQDLAAARQALQTSEADHDLVQAKYQARARTSAAPHQRGAPRLLRAHCGARQSWPQSRLHKLEQQLTALQKQLDDGEQSRRRLRDEHDAAVEALRLQCLASQGTTREEQVRAHADAGLVTSVCVRLRALQCGTGRHTTRVLWRIEGAFCMHVHAGARAGAA